MKSQRSHTSWTLVPFFCILFIGILPEINAQSAQFREGQMLVQPVVGNDLRGCIHDFQYFEGQPTGLKLERKVSDPMRIWLLSFHPNIDIEDFLKTIRQHPAVRIAQKNHWITPRATLPNDPMVDQQWQYVNNGANGGVVDADIDADLAWDITTGGITAMGDSIVACIVDDGTDYTHPDLIPNHWINHGEIPGNQMDDDGNGYVDDYMGWNSYNDNDDVDNGWHGTSVVGIVGAKGNNGVGVAGVNWNVKNMVVSGGGDEANVLASYSYPLVMRQRYNASNGAEGAFVVVTNSSWGTDFGQPADAPLWCAMYDTLGKYGILSCGATINGNENVDVVGDLPTACPSEYLISVTNMNRSDVKVTQAGYGATTIDLGAFGQDAFTTELGGGYGGFGGTSGATPHVAGSIALLYSVPCPALIDLAKNYPDSAARTVRDAILNGVDPNSSLTGITTTGGRLNLHTSVLQILSNCDSSVCLPPFALSADDITDTSATLLWSALAPHDSFRVVLTLSGTGSMVVQSPSFSLSDLDPCSEYGFQVSGFCEGTETAYSTVFEFKTDGCCEAPTEITVDEVSENSVLVSWSPVLAANGYTLFYQIIGETSWTSVSVMDSNSLTLSGLSSCSQYQIQLQTDCDTGISALSPMVSFNTLGCGFCVDAEYCDASGDNTDYEWIESVQLQDLTHVSGDNNGYGDFTLMGTTLLRDVSYSMTLTPGFEFFEDTEFFRVWIDFDQDGIFDMDDELVLETDIGVQATYTDSFTIPSLATLGNTRMRVAMQYEQAPNACGAFDYGEVEDYCVLIDEFIASEIQVSSPDLILFPNPIVEGMKLSVRNIPTDLKELTIVDVQGRELLRLERRQLDISGNACVFSFPKNWVKGIYFVKVSSLNGESVQKLIVK